MKKRKWCYIMQPTAYEIVCDICGGSDITWSEFETRIWCYDCEKDTPGTGGIFSGPIPINLCALMGISFDRIDIKTQEIIKMKEVGDRLVWRKIKKKPGAHT